MLKINFKGITGQSKTKIEYVGRNDLFPAMSHFNKYAFGFEYTWKYIILNPFRIIKIIIRYYSK